MKKNDIVTVTIEDMSSEGLGVGRSNGLTLFVKDTIIGDIAEVKVMKMKKTYGFARLMRLIEPGGRPYRAAVSGSKTVRRMSDTGDELRCAAAILKRIKYAIICAHRQI